MSGETSTRPYDGTRRREAGRERVLAAAVRLARAQSGWTWEDLTFRAVAAEAGTSERTVYRHFPSQADLHSALMERLREEADVSFEGLAADEVADTARAMFRSLAHYAPVRRGAAASVSPALVEMDRRRREALLAATGGDRATAAALDVLWGVEAYELLVQRWGMTSEEAAEVAGRAIEAVLAGRGGGTSEPGR